MGAALRRAHAEGIPDDVIRVFKHALLAHWLRGTTWYAGSAIKTGIAASLIHSSPRSDRGNSPRPTVSRDISPSFTDNSVSLPLRGGLHQRPSPMFPSIIPVFPAFVNAGIGRSHTTPVPCPRLSSDSHNLIYYCVISIFLLNFSFPICSVISRVSPSLSLFVGRALRAVPFF